MLSLALACALCGPQWVDYESARLAHKPILVEFSTTDCLHCTRQEAVLREPRVRRALRGFVCVRGNDRLAQAFGITTYPTIVLSDPTGQWERVRGEGFQSAEQVIELAKKAN